MSLPLYPAVLPTWDVENYTVEPRQSFVSTDFEQGPSRNRRLYTNVPYRHQGATIMTDEELSIFMYWYTHEIADGSLWFSMEIPFAGQVQPVDCKFWQGYRWQRLKGPHVRLSAFWDVRDAPLISESQYSALTA